MKEELNAIRLDPQQSVKYSFDQKFWVIADLSESKYVSTAEILAVH